jgi:hypothetical protein
MSGWTVADAVTNKSLPVGGTNNSGAGVPYIAPAPGFQDAVGKMRVSTPQSLIDTDFEYGTQATKWESISLQNNRQSCYYQSQSPLTITAITGGGGQTATLTGTFVLATGDVVYIQNSLNSNLNGWFYITSGGTNTAVVTFTPGTVTANGTNYYSATTTYAYKGYFYSNCGFTIGTGGVVVTSASVITVTTTHAHGLAKGSLIYIVGTTGGTNVNGAFTVATVPTANTFTLTAASASGTVTATAGNVNVYARPAGYVEPRTFDGGVSFSAGGGVPDQQLIRQTRRYFRYQSGKGIQFSTGTCLKPSLFVSSMTTSASTTITVVTRYNHNLAVGTNIVVTGAIQGAYNGSWTVATVDSPTQFTFTTTQVPSANTATGDQIRIFPNSWYGAANKIGMFDQQNGMFFEFDGQTLYAVLRNSTNQVNGTVTVTQGSGAVTGSGTSFLSQLNPGDFVVIRGQSYRILTISSDTAMQICPEYRGGSIANAVVSKTIDFKYPQSSWTDPLNGNGPSGYNLDLSKMQMWYIDYSWYGAGFIRWGMRASNGQINYVFQLQNNNKQFEAYMRSGNMASHYESNGIAPLTNLVDNLAGSGSTLSADITDSSTTIPLTSATTFATAGYIKISSEIIYYNGKSGNSLINCQRAQFGTAEQNFSATTAVTQDSIPCADTSKFPPNGTVYVTANGNTGVIEYIQFARNVNGYLQGLTRAATGGQASAQAFTYSVSAPVTVEYGQTETTPALAHWGSSVIMDGLFNDDKSLIFNYGTTIPVTLTATASCPILAVRVGPSADNGTIGTLGLKEVINRMQLQLVELGVVTSGTMLINLILNGVPSAFSGVFQSPTQGNTFTASLAQVAQNTTAGATISNGESVAAAYTNTTGQTTLDLGLVRDLGNSILGGGTSNSVPTSQAGQYPDGPDILYVVATNISGATNSIQARLSWKEAQA